MKKRRAHYKGYTLVELLVVMLISGILLSMGAVEYGTATSESKAQSFRSSVLTALSGAESYRQKYGEYPDTDTFNDLLRDQRYFSIPPKNPYTGQTLQATTDTSPEAKEKLGYFYYSVTPDGNIKVETNPSLDIDVAQMEEPDKQAPSMYNVSFTVVDSNGSPISGAQIMINGKTLTTDSEGKTTTALAAGTYFYSVTKTGYNFVNGSLTVSGDTSKTITMNSSSFTVTVIVKSDSGDPIMGARVTGIGSGEQTTDAEGKATFTGISAGTYNIIATATGYEQTSLAVTVKSNQQVRLTMPKQRFYTVSVVVTDTNGNPIEGAVIKGIGSGGVTGSDGKVAISNVTAGTYTITAVANGYSMSSQTISVSENQSVSFTLTQLLYSVTVHVTDADTGAAISGASVMGIGSGGTTDANGKVTFNNVTYGSYTISVSAMNYQSNSQTVEISSSQTVPIQLQIKRASSISVTVKNSSGSAISGASVSINGVGSANTNSSGVATFSNVPYKSYNISVSASGYSTYSGVITVNDTNTTFSITLSPLSYTITVHVTDADTGAAVSGASVTGIGSGGTTDANGNVTFNNVTPGVYNLTISATNYNSYVTVVTADSSKGINVALTRQKAVAVNIHVIDTYNSSGLSGAQVTISNGMGTLNTNSSGDVTFVQVPYGSYTLTITATHYQTVSMNITVDKTNLNFSIPVSRNTYTIVVYARDAITAQDLENALVELSNGSYAYTDASGRASLSVVWIPTIQVVVSKSGYSSAVRNGAFTGNMTVLLRLYPK